jgi:hypothetical protein
MEMRESRIADHVGRGVKTMNKPENNAAPCCSGTSLLALSLPAADGAEPFSGVARIVKAKPKL